MRPLYQEWLLPNLAYVGGGGELAHWLQLGSAFENLGRPMPLLYLRNSVLVQDSKLTKNLKKLGITCPMSSPQMRKSSKGSCWVKTLSYRPKESHSKPH